MKTSLKTPSGLLEDVIKARLLELGDKEEDEHMQRLNRLIGLLRQKEMVQFLTADR